MIAGHGAGSQQKLQALLVVCSLVVVGPGRVQAFLRLGAAVKVPGPQVRVVISWLLWEDRVPLPVTGFLTRTACRTRTWVGEVHWQLARAVPGVRCGAWTCLTSEGGSYRAIRVSPGTITSLRHGALARPAGCGASGGDLVEKRETSQASAVSDSDSEAHWPRLARADSSTARSRAKPAGLASGPAVNPQRAGGGRCCWQLLMHTAPPPSNFHSEE